MDDLEARFNKLMGIETIDDYPIDPITEYIPKRKKKTKNKRYIKKKRRPIKLLRDKKTY